LRRSILSRLRLPFRHSRNHKDHTGSVVAGKYRIQHRVQSKPIEAAPSLALPWVTKLRYGLLAGESALILAAHYVFGVELPIPWLILPVAVAAIGNPLLERFTGAFSDRQALGILLTLDTLCLTALLSLTGGPANPFTLLYLVQITLSAVILSEAWTWAIGGLSVAGFAFAPSCLISTRLAACAPLRAELSPRCWPSRLR